MQTFLPYPSFSKSARCLDRLRLGKQRVECLQLAKTNLNGFGGWYNHPAAKMWRGHGVHLCLYWQEVINEWKRRGYVDNTELQLVTFHKLFHERNELDKPGWLGNRKFHRSHQSNLIRKDEQYRRYFGNTVPDNLPYIWPKGLNHHA